MTASIYRRLPFAATLLIFPVFLQAQVPVDEDGNVIGQVQSEGEVLPPGEDGIPRLSSTDLQELVGPVALYPDDLLAVVLPASAYPLQIAAAERFLEAREDDAALEPDPDWDDSVVALLNYPEVVELMNDDLDWTYRLGEAVVAQQEDVIAAIESFRDRAYAAGNLKSDSYQTVARNEGTIHITPVEEDVIYVPYYEPARVVTYQRRPAYYYYPRPYPVYYYPYAADYHFHRGYFWGVTTAFRIGWYSDSLNVWHHSYRGHPYYGRHYRSRYWYRRPTINFYNSYYRNNSVVTINRYSRNRHYRGDRWRARSDRRRQINREGFTRSRRDQVGRIATQRNETRRAVNRSRQSEQIRFRDRTATVNRNTNRIRKRAGRTAPPGELRERRRDTAVNQRNVRQRSLQRRDATTRGNVRQRTTRVERARPQRESRARRSAPQRATAPQRTARSQRSAPPRAQQRRAAPQREQRPRSAPQREQRSRSAPQREQRQRAAPQRKSSARQAPRARSGSERRRSVRRERR